MLGKGLFNMGDRLFRHCPPARVRVRHQEHAGAIICLH